MTLLNPAGVFVESHVELPMQTVFNSPVLAQHVSAALSIQATAADEVTHLRAGLAIHGPFAGTHAHAGQLWPQSPIVNGLDAMHDDGRPRFLPAMPPLGGGVPV